MRTPLLFLVFALVATGDRSATAQAATKRPNILFIFSDDHATDAIGAYGGRLAGLNPTPHIDALAAQGMLFRNSFCTNAICGPSRAVILTGKHSHVNGFMRNGNRFDGDQQTFPKLLRAVGYRTAVIGKWHLGSEPQGFDHWEVLPGQGDYYNPVLESAAGKRRVEGYCTDVVTDLAIEWLEGNAGEQPFLLMCQHKAPHRNWMPAPRHLRSYAEGEIPEPETLFDTFEDNASPARRAEMRVDEHLNLVYDLFVPPDEDWDPSAGVALDSSGFRNLDDMTEAQRAAWDAAFAADNEAFRAAGLTGRDLVRWKYQRYMRNYLATVRGLDEGVGRLLEWLDRAGLADDTIVVYASDQGFYLGDHGWYDKRWMYDESLRMPLIVRWPGRVAPGSVDTHLVQNLDYAATFLEAAGVAVPADLQGRSLLPLLRGAPVEDWRTAIYYHYFAYPSVHMVARHYGIRTERFKLIRFYQMDEWELYDLQTDPDERTNVFGESAMRGVAARLAEQLGALRAHFGDQTDVAVMPDEWRRQQRRG